ncbi:MAG: glycoside hydrolase family 78 protein [Paludibacteraceae bacterium]
MTTRIVKPGISILFMLFSGLFSLNNSLQAITVVKDLRVEYMKNPIGIDVTNPHFSWAMESDEIAKRQIAYEITVSDNGTVIWSSGQVNSDKSISIKYDGPALSPSIRYSWKVDVWDNEKAMISSAENAYFETGLLSSGWSGAKWLKIRRNTENDTLANFTFACDMTVVDQNAGVIFGAKDVNNMYMWAINTYRTNTDYPVLRRHIFKNGNVTFTDVPLQGIFTKEQIIGKERRLKIEVVNNVINTYLDSILIDTYFSQELRNGYIGFRVYTGDNDTHEHAYIDNVEYSYYDKDINANSQLVTFSENFENGSNDFDGTKTIVIDGNTKMDLQATGNSDFRVLQSSASGIPMFRTEFALNKEIKSARIYASGLGIYDMFINGKRVGTPQEDGSTVYDELKPGWTDYRKTVFYSTYDITNLLNAGQNAVGAQVSSGWLTGGIAHNEYGNPDLGFIAKLVVTYTDGSQEILVTNPN